MIAFNIKSLDLNLNETDAEGEATLQSELGLPAVPIVLQPHPGQRAYGPPAVMLEVDAEGLKRGR